MFQWNVNWHRAKGIFCVIDPCGVAFHNVPYGMKGRAETFLVFDVEIGKMFIVDYRKQFVHIAFVEGEVV